jgi:hypothetical protein
LGSDASASQWKWKNGFLFLVCFSANVTKQKEYSKLGTNATSRIMNHVAMYYAAAATAATVQ